VLLIKVVLPPLDKYNCFQLASRCLIFLITPLQIGLALKEALYKRPRYFIGKEETLHPKILAKPSALLTLPIETNYDLAKLTKVKRKRELKNLECSINYEARERPSLERCHCQQGLLGPKMHFPFLQWCIKGFVSFRAGGGLLWVVVLGFFLWFTVWLWLLVGFLGWVFLGFDFGFKLGYLCILSCVSRGALRFF
jgi:hypothetical protein